VEIMTGTIFLFVLSTFTMLCIVMAAPGLLLASLRMWVFVGRAAFDFSQWCVDLVAAIEDGRAVFYERRKQRAL
jgi:hypothetical protein